MSAAMDERKWAVVLGVSCGTGAAIAQSLAADPGLHIFGAHRGNHPESAAATEQAIHELGRRACFMKCDVGNAEGAVRGADELLAAAGPRSVSLFVHSIANASVRELASGGEAQVTPRQIQKTFDGMAHSFIYWIQELFRRDLFAPGAQMLGLSNWIEDSVIRGTALIAATKATLGIYVRHLAHELGPRGYKVNLLKFGGVITPAVEKTFGPEHLEKLRRVLTRVSASRRISTLEEVARFVSVLASDAASRFNGATIDFTGGESLALFDALMNFDSNQAEAT